jgi:hypothetical protein
LGAANKCACKAHLRFALTVDGNDLLIYKTKRFKKGELPMNSTISAPSAIAALLTTPINRTARLAGLLYLLIAICGGFSFFYVRTTLIVPGDAAATFANLVADTWLLRLGLGADALVFLSEILLIALLYTLLMPVSQTVARAASHARLATVVLQGVNLINYALVLLLVGGAGYLTAFDPAQRESLAFFLLMAYEQVALIWGFFFGLHTLLLGLLVYRSGYLPRLLGVLMLLAALGYWLDSFGNFLLPQYAAFFEVAVVPLALLGELPFTLWLLIRGVRVGVWQQRAASSTQLGLQPANA